MTAFFHVWASVPVVPEGVAELLVLDEEARVEEDATELDEAREEELDEEAREEELDDEEVEEALEELEELEARVDELEAEVVTVRHWEYQSFW